MARRGGALGLEPYAEGYGLVLGQDSGGARWTVVVDDVSLVAVAIASWDCGMEYDLSPDDRAAMRLAERPGPARAVVYGALLAAGAWVNAYVLMLLPAHLLAVAVLHGWRRPPARWVAAAGAVAPEPSERGEPPCAGVVEARP